MPMNDTERKEVLADIDAKLAAKIPSRLRESVSWSTWVKTNGLTTIRLRSTMSKRKETGRTAKKSPI